MSRVAGRESFEGLPEDTPEHDPLFSTERHLLRDLSTQNDHYRDLLENGATDFHQSSLSKPRRSAGQIPEGWLEDSLGSSLDASYPPYTIAYSIKRFFNGLHRWARGPSNPKPFTIIAVLPRVQSWPLDLLDEYVPSRKWQISLFIFWQMLGTVVFMGILAASLSRCKVPGYPDPVRLSCSSRFWCARLLLT